MAAAVAGAKAAAAAAIAKAVPTAKRPCCLSRPWRLWQFVAPSGARVSSQGQGLPWKALVGTTAAPMNATTLKAVAETTARTLSNGGEIAVQDWCMRVLNVHCSCRTRAT